jgi:hypothetical protein
MVWFAIEAARARRQRKVRGTTLAIVGGVLFTAGAAAALVGADAPSSYRCAATEEGGSCDDFGGVAALGLIAMGVLVGGGGLTLGIVGVHKLRTPSEVEETALKRYYADGSPPRPVVFPRRASVDLAGSSGKTVTLRLLSFAF